MIRNFVHDDSITRYTVRKKIEIREDEVAFSFLRIFSLLITKIKCSSKVVESCLENINLKVK